MARLPEVGGDNGNWGEILNDFLLQSHAVDGQLKDGAVSEAKLDTALATKINSTPASPVSSVAGKTGDVSLTKTDVGLTNVDNTSDTDKPVSTATQTALGTKLDKLTTSNALAVYTVDSAGTQSTRQATSTGMASGTVVLRGASGSIVGATPTTSTDLVNKST